MVALQRAIRAAAQNFDVFAASGFIFLITRTPRKVDFPPLGNVPRIGSAPWFRAIMKAPLDIVIHAAFTGKFFANKVDARPVQGGTKAKRNTIAVIRAIIRWKISNMFAEYLALTFLPSYAM